MGYVHDTTMMKLVEFSKYLLLGGLNHKTPELPLYKHKDIEYSHTNWAPSFHSFPFLFLK